ncbi:MAG: DUF4928 domain-containing protein [Hymenobacter sp.]|nr:MAG: DUF4928 domain-containing protein [Hymenobacter sp.]
MKAALENFYRESGFNSKGPLSVAVQLTKVFTSKVFPLFSEEFIVGRGGQVKGLSGSTLKKILLSYGIERTLSSEGGRTSRGSIDNMRTYVNFLNNQYRAGNPIDWKEIEEFWIEKVRAYFDAAPFTLNIDASQSVRAVISNLTQQALERQRQVTGVKYLGTMMQHLVGAKLDVVMGIGSVVHNCASNNDQEHGRTGDFDIGDVSIHVTTRPSDGLFAKCCENLRANRRPLIITVGSGVSVAEELARETGIEDRIDIIDFIQFIVANIHERSSFERAERHQRIEQLVERYNSIIDEFETDPSLRIEVAQGR